MRKGAEAVSADLRVRSLVGRVLAGLDGASDHIEELRHAVQFSDVDRLLTIKAKLQTTWSEAHVAILMLEEVSGCPEVRARAALRQSRRRAESPLERAWGLLARLPRVPHHPEPRTRR